MTTNIVATITGNGAALTAEINKTFGAIPGMAKRVGDQVGDLFGDGVKKGADELRVAIKASERSIQEIRSNIRNTNGAIQIDTSGMKAQIAARQQELQAIEAVERAISRKAAKESDATRDTQVYLATLRATVDQERQSIAALTVRVQTLDALQNEIGQTATQQARLNATSGQARAGMQQLSFQISDVAQSLASGVSPMVVFGQQASQVVQAVGMMRQTSGGLIGFLQGPWGAALMGAGIIAGVFASKLGDTAVAAENVKFATNKMSDAQGILGNVMDMTTGKINTQNSALVALAKAQILVAQVQAKTRASEARRGVQAIQDRAFQFNGGMGGGFSVGRRPLDARDAISRGVLAEKLDSKVAIERLDNLRKVGRLTDDQFASAAASVANLGLELQNLKVFENAEKLLDGTGGRSLLKPVVSSGRASGGSSAANDNARAAQQTNETEQALLKQEEVRKRISDSIAEDISRLRTVASIDALRARGLTLQADQEEAISGLRGKYRDLLDGEPDIAAKVLGITEEQVRAMREQLQIAEKLTVEQVQRNADRDATLKFFSVMDDYYKGQERDKKQRAEDANREAREQMEELASFYERAFQSGGRSIWSDFKQLGKRALAEIAAQMTIKLMGGGSSAQGGGLVGGLLDGGINAVSNLLGLNRNKNSTQGGGSSAGDVAGSVGGASGLLNKVKIPGIGGLGDIAGGAMLAMTVFSSLMKKTKTGSATLSFANGELGVGATRGNSQSRIGAAKDGVGGIADMLTQIAEGLGGTISGAGSVSLGMRKKSYVVDPTGQGRTKGAGVLKFKDEQDAIEAAVRDALQDGVISGISEAAKRILSSGQDLQKAIQKAATIESIPKALKARLNPVGAALDELNAKWDQTIATLKEGGASAEQMADAEKLYRLEREDALKAANDNLKEFINSLNFGSSSTYSLIDQSKAARADLDKYLGNINSGNFGAVDQQKYLASAQSFLEIQRELSGSGTGWFNSVDELRTATQKLADGLEKGSSEAAARDPFAEATATNTQAMADILAQQTGQLANIETYLATLAAGSSGGSGGGSNFIGADRGFLQRAL
jgi:hypothetical protein